MTAKSLCTKIFLVTVMIAFITAPGGASAPGALDPGAMQRVVVRGSDSSGLAQAVAQAGGRVISDLPFIHAVVVEIPAARLDALAAHPQVIAISPDAPVVSTGCRHCRQSPLENNIYPDIVDADLLWSASPALRGKGVTVAVVDSGYTDHADLRRTVKSSSETRIRGINFTDSATALDLYGHGTHVAGIIGGNGAASRKLFMGMAPKADLMSIKVCGDDGACYTSDVLEGLQWINDNGHAQGIRIVNLSMNSTVLESYHTNPLCAALEALWFNGFVVVVAAGNTRDGQLYPPANDPFVITVGSTDDQGTVSVLDDAVSSFSGYGVTEQGIPKPDLVAPGRDVVSLLNSTQGGIALEHPDNIVEGRARLIDDYFRISGTSVSTAVVSGAAALLLEAQPELNPDQVKHRLMATAVRSDGWPGYDPQTAGAGMLNIYNAVHSDTLEAANTGVVISQQLWTEEERAAFEATNSGSVNWGTVNWGSVNWGSVNWGSVSWGSVSWGSVSWGSVSWGSVSWGSDFWEDQP